MRTLQELFDMLAMGEFSNIAIGQSTISSITEEAYPRIVSAINLGLRKLYRLFVLSRKEIKVYQQPDVTFYYLQEDRIAEPSAMNADAYLEDNDTMPFTGGIVRILEAYDEMGRQVHINDPRFPGDIFMMAADQFKLALPPVGAPTRIISIGYQAYHPEIQITEDFDPTTIQLNYPDFIETALLNFIASRVFKGKTSKASEGAQQPYSTFQYQFDRECQEIKNLGLALTGAEERLICTKFDEKGWC